MLIAGAGGHAVDLLSILKADNYAKDIVFFNDTNEPDNVLLKKKYTVLHSLGEAKKYLGLYPDFCLGTGNVAGRKILTDKLTSCGGKLVSIISTYAFIGTEAVELGEGLNIMQGAVITAHTKIGKGTLVHVHASIHHDTIIGEYCELSPGCRILGCATIGSFVSIGTNAVIMPGVKIGDNAIIGAGAVVTKEVPAKTTVVGVPAKERI